MAFAKYIFSALAAASTALAQCSEQRITIQNQGDATALANCQDISGDVVIAPQTTNSIQLNGIQSIKGDLIVNNATGLSALSADQLSSIGGDWVLQDLTILSTLQFDSLEEVGTIRWTTLPALQSLTFNKGITTAKNVGISNTQLNNLDGIELMQVGSLDINNNGFMAEINVNNLRNLTGVLNFAANAENLKVSFPNLVGAGNMTFRNISSLSMPSLARINGALGLYSNGFSTISTPNLTIIDGDFGIQDCAQLNNLSMPILRGVNGGFTMSENPKLTNLDGFPKVEAVSGAIDVSGPIEKFSLPALRDARGLFNFQTSESGFDCSAFKKASDSRIIKGKYNCQADRKNPGGANSTSSSAGSSPTGKGAAGHLEVNVSAAFGLVSLIAALFMV